MKRQFWPKCPLWGRRKKSLVRAGSGRTGIPEPQKSIEQGQIFALELSRRSNAADLVAKIQNRVKSCRQWGRFQLSIESHSDHIDQLMMDCEARLSSAIRTYGIADLGLGQDSICSGPRSRIQRPRGERELAIAPLSRRLDLRPISSGRRQAVAPSRRGRRSRQAHPILQRPCARESIWMQVAQLQKGSRRRPRFRDRSQDKADRAYRRQEVP